MLTCFIHSSIYELVRICNADLKIIGIFNPIFMSIPSLD